MPIVNHATVTRAEVEDLLFREAELLDAWRLDDWLGLLTEDACYYVPPNDLPDADPRFTLFTIADDMVRLKERVIRLKDPNCHAEFPHSRTRRLIGNVRIADVAGDTVTADSQLHHLPSPPAPGAAHLRRPLPLQAAPCRWRPQDRRAPRRPRRRGAGVAGCRELYSLAARKRRMRCPSSIASTMSG